MTPVHPRADFAPLLRVEAQKAAIDAVLSRGRLHHAWLLCGPQGVGKSRFAYRIARRLLGSASDAAAPDGDDPETKASRLIAARAHPDFMALHRESEDLKPRRVIPVDEARRLPEFFSKAPSQAAYRVAIVDAADDLNVNAANAILKTLEEPPKRGVLILVSHSPGRLLDTIRSRCRRLNFSPWPEAELGRWLEGLGLDAAAAGPARGSPGRALALARAKHADVEVMAADLLSHLPGGNEGALQKLAEGFRGVEGADRFTALTERLADQVRVRLCAGVARGGLGGGEAWAKAWTALVQAPQDAEALNLDRSDTFWSALALLRAAARERPLAC